MSFLREIDKFVNDVEKAVVSAIDGEHPKMNYGFKKGYDAPPNGMMLGYQQDGSGEFWLAVANTKWGRIPGKAKCGMCWYSYGTREHSTKDFDYVTHPNTMITMHNHNGVPHAARPIGYQNDGRGDQYSGIANTRWGKIPGKACGNTCWYTNNGKEYETKDFEWLACSRLNSAHHNNLMDISFVQQPHPPLNGLKFGRQHDGGGDQWIAVAETPYGKIPGKAKDGTCWYGYNGTEYTTNNFHYVIQTSPHQLIRNNNTGPPKGAINVGHQTDGKGVQYAAIATSQFGRIPGKAHGNTCWYAYNGVEHETKDFEWVVFEK